MLFESNKDYCFFIYKVQLLVYLQGLFFSWFFIWGAKDVQPNYYFFVTRVCLRTHRLYSSIYYSQHEAGNSYVMLCANVQTQQDIDTKTDDVGELNMQVSALRQELSDRAQVTMATVTPLMYHAIAHTTHGSYMATVSIKFIFYSFLLS